MNYPFLLKFSSISNLSDARFAAGAFADLIGFNFNPENSAYLEPNKAKEIISWVNGPQLCGEFTYQPVEWVQDFIKGFKLPVVQIPVDYPFPEIFEISDTKFMLEVDSLEKVIPHPHADSYICSEINIYNALKTISDKPVFLDLKDLGYDVSEIDGIALSGVYEDRPGTRNHADWMEFLEYWEEEVS